MRRRISFYTEGVEGQRRPRFRKVGRDVIVYKLESDCAREDLIAAAYVEACKKIRSGPVFTAPKGTPVRVSIATRRDVMSAFRKRDGNFQPDTSKPDADNIAKSVLDALNGLAWADDAQVHELHVYKLDRERGAEPKTLVNIEWEE